MARAMSTRSLTMQVAPDRAQTATSRAPRSYSSRSVQPLTRNWITGAPACDRLGGDADRVPAGAGVGEHVQPAEHGITPSGPAGGPHDRRQADSAVSTAATARLTSEADQPLAGSMPRSAWRAPHQAVQPAPGAGEVGRQGQLVGDEAGDPRQQQQRPGRAPCSETSQAPRGTRK